MRVRLDGGPANGQTIDLGAGPPPVEVSFPSGEWVHFYRIARTLNVEHVYEDAAGVNRVSLPSLSEVERYEHVPGRTAPRFEALEPEFQPAGRDPRDVLRRRHAQDVVVPVKQEVAGGRLTTEEVPQ